MQGGYEPQRNAQTLTFTAFSLRRPIFFQIYNARILAFTVKRWAMASGEPPV
jgi:hypothetical protein